MTEATYTCAKCGGTFGIVRDQNEARQEFAILFPDHDIRDAAVVCDDCFRALGLCEEGHQ